MPRAPGGVDAPAPFQGRRGDDPFQGKAEWLTLTLFTWAQQDLGRGMTNTYLLRWYHRPSWLFSTLIYTNNTANW